MRRTFHLIGIALLAAGAAGLACAQQQGAQLSGHVGGVHGASPAHAGHAGGHGGEHGSVVHGVSGSLGRGGVVVRQGGGHFERYGRGYRGYGVGYGYWPYATGSYDSGDEYQSSAPAPEVPVQRGPEIVDRLTPAPDAATPVNSAIKEYKWPAAGAAKGAATTGAASAQTGDQDEQAFALVLKDGSTLSAQTVYATDGRLHYVDPDGRHLQIPMDEVDRTATLKVNRERNLRLYLPAS